MVYVKRMHLDMPELVTEVAVFSDDQRRAAEELAKTRQSTAGASEVYWASTVPTGVVHVIHAA